LGTAGSQAATSRSRRVITQHNYDVKRLSSPVQGSMKAKGQEGGMRWRFCQTQQAPGLTTLAGRTLEVSRLVMRCWTSATQPTGGAHLLRYPCWTLTMS
jgi:hypothetical protein